MRLLNASGCLDALTAPDVARELDAFVTKTVTPLPREGNQPVRIAETDVGMLNAIGLANPGIDRFLSDHLPRLAELGLPLWVSVGGFQAQDFADLCAQARPLRRSRRHRAEPLLPERGRGPRERGRDRGARPRRDPQAALREALAGGDRRRRDRTRRGSLGSRRAQPREHDQGPRAGRADAPPGAGTRSRRALRAGVAPDRARGRLGVPPSDRSPHRRHGRRGLRTRRARAARGRRERRRARDDPVRRSRRTRPSPGRAGG